MSTGSREFCVSKAPAGAKKGVAARLCYARAGSEVAEVANRPKKRPGRRERSSMTIRLTTPAAVLV
jgi:hypothetical protein